MSYDYSGLQATAKRLLGNYGRVQKIALNVVASGPIDFATGEATQTTTTYQFDAVTVGYRNNEIDGTRVLAGDVLVIAEAGHVLAAVGNTVTIDGVVWRIIATAPVNPGGVLLVQKWQVRK